MSETASVADLDEVLFDAALQSKFMQARRRDLIAEAETTTRFLYGIDTNVLRYWGNPRTTSPERPTHLGRIFRGDENDLATSISWGLLTFIFERLGSGSIPLIIVPPMEREVASTLQALHETDPDEPSPAVQREIRKILDMLGEAIPPDQLSALTVELQELLFQGIGEHQELLRMLLAFSRQRIKTLDDAAPLMPAPLRATLLPTENILSRWIAYRDARSGDKENEGWTERLKRSGHWKSELLRDNDADALARIEVWNRQFVRDKAPWRVLYITADMRLFEAAGDYRDFESSEDRRSFADTYLRHPRAYLSEDGVLGPVMEVGAGETVAADGESVGDWLRLATHSTQDRFGDLYKGWRPESLTVAGRPIFDDASEIVRESGAQSATALASSLLQKWRQFAQGALAADPAPAEGLLGLTRDRKPAAIEMLRLIHAQRHNLEAERRSTLRQYLYVTTRLGQTLEARQKALLIRAVPPIFFEDWRGAGRAVALMGRWPHDVVDDDSYQEVVHLTDQDDATSYAFYLANASFFAARDRWRAGALLARRARGIAQAVRAATTEGQTKGANGREAAYFESVCRAQLARARDELPVARECLETAASILACEKAEGKYHDFVEERLTLQAHTIDLVDFYFLSSDTFDPDAYLSTFRELADRFWLSVCQTARKRDPLWAPKRDPFSTVFERRGA